MYPFSISIDEHVPLNMAAGRIFSREGPTVDFPWVGEKYVCRGAKSAKIYIFPTETKTTNFITKNLMGKCQTSKYWVLTPLPTPMTLKLLLAKRLRKITKIYLLIS